MEKNGRGTSVPGGRHRRFRFAVFTFLPVLLIALAIMTPALFFGADKAEADTPPPDTMTPIFFNLHPTGWIDGLSSMAGGVYVDFLGPINGSTALMLMQYENGPWTEPVYCDRNDNAIECQMSWIELAPGHYTLEIAVADYAGNWGMVFWPVDVDTAYPVVTGVSPSGTVSGTTTISASFNDPGHASGINADSANLTLDGTPLTGCTKTATGISCPAGPLGAGPHTIGGSVKDNVNHQTQIFGSFNEIVCSGDRPGLTLSQTGADWLSYSDYLARSLTVRYMISNNTGPDANNVLITNVSNTDGVTLAGTTPGPLDVPNGAWLVFHVTYYIPAGVTGFNSSFTATAADACGTGFTYP